MLLKIGDIDTYQVVKQTDIAYTLKTLSNDDIEIFLHFNQTTSPLNVGDKVQAFLYYDQKKRLCATTEEPLITVNKPNFCKVVAKRDGAGLFLNMGIAKDILLSSDYLPINDHSWPQVDEEVPCIVKIKTDQLIAKIVTHDEIQETKKLEVGTSVDAIVYKLGADGINALTKDWNSIFIHKSLLRKKYHLGEAINVKIININERETYNGSTIPNKEIARLDDADVILRYLKMHGGSIPLGDKSTPEEITKYFPLSKSAFKRAIGNLYRNKLITIKENLITLN